MKILQVVPSLDPRYGGATTNVLALAFALAKHGHQVEIFSTNAGAQKTMSVPLQEPVCVRGVKIFYFPSRPPRKIKFSFSLSQALKKRVPEFDLVHIHSLFQFSTLSACHYCRRYQRPYLITTLGQLDSFSLRKNRLLKYIYLALCEQRNLRGAALLHFACEEERGYLRERRLREKGVVIPLLTDSEELQNLPEYGLFRKRYFQLDGKKVILFLSRIDPKKGLDILVKSFAALARDRKDIALVVAGPDNSGFASAVRKRLRKERAAERVVFTGMLSGSDKLAAFRDSDIFVLPSYSENFGLAVAEAMFCGLPVVVSNRVGIHGAVARSHAGLVIEPGVTQLSSALAELLDNPALRRQMGANGRMLSQERFSWEKAATEMLSQYNKILQQNQ